jgi:hypothetical protein
MKQTILLLVVLFAAGVASAQNVFKLGTTVKGKHVTYEVKPIAIIDKREDESFSRCLVRNIHNPDTVLKARVYREEVKRGFFVDLSLQIGAILHDHLSKAELAKLDEKDRKNEPYGESMGVMLRVDSTGHKLLQVTCFMFYNHYVAAQDRAKRGEQWPGDPVVAYDGFWLNFDPDRLYAIEKDIVERLVLPEDTPEIYLVEDIEVYISTDQMLDPEKAKAKWTAHEAGLKERI